MPRGFTERRIAAPDSSTAGRVAHEVRVALLRWEPRIEVLGVDVGYEAIDEGVLLIDIRYQPARSNDPRNLVFPFYVIPEEPGAEVEATEAWAADVFARSSPP